MHIIVVAAASIWAFGALLALVLARAAGRRAPQPDEGLEPAEQGNAS
ncbi:MAG: hypothetical protein AB7T32_03945 [Dehalococcoidia bacterium]